MKSFVLQVIAITDENVEPEKMVEIITGALKYALSADGRLPLTGPVVHLTSLRVALPGVTEVQDGVVSY